MLICVRERDAPTEIRDVVSPVHDVAHHPREARGASMAPSTMPSQAPSASLYMMPSRELLLGLGSLALAPPLSVLPSLPHRCCPLPYLHLKPTRSGGDGYRASGGRAHLEHRDVDVLVEGEVGAHPLPR